MRCGTAHHHLRHPHVCYVARTFFVFEGKRRREDFDAREEPLCAILCTPPLTPFPSPHRFPQSVEYAELANKAIVHPVVEGHDVDLRSNGGAKGPVIGEHVLRRFMHTAMNLILILDVVVGPSLINAIRDVAHSAMVNIRGSARSSCEGIPHQFATTT